MVTILLLPLMIINIELRKIMNSCGNNFETEEQRDGKPKCQTTLLVYDELVAAPYTVQDLKMIDIIERMMKICPSVNSGFLPLRTLIGL